MRIMPGVNWRPVPSHGGAMVAHQGLVLHVQVGNNSCYGEFANPANEASSTWWVSKTGVIEQYVDADIAAWAEAAGNSRWDSVETEGEPTEALTQAQILSLARIFVYGHQQYGWPLQKAETPSGTGFGWHGMGGTAWGGHFGCPGDLRKSQRDAIIYIAGLVLNPGAAPKPTPPPPPPPPKGQTMIANVPTGGIIVARPDGALDNFEGSEFYGSMAGTKLNAPIIAICATATGKGYWMLGADGGVFTFGDAPYLGPLPKYLDQWNVGLNKHFTLIGIARSANPAYGYLLIADNPADKGAATYGILADGSLTK